MRSGMMSWVIADEGRSDQTGLLLLFDDRQEAKSIAAEVRHAVIVCPYPVPNAEAPTVAYLR
jgi:hypothetical protein